MTSYSLSSRFWEGVAFDPAIKAAWGTPLSTNFTLIDSAINGTSTVDLTGLTTYTLTTANGAPDQAREKTLNFSGALTAVCTVTLPNVPKIGFAVNSSTGGFNVVMTAGSGTTVSIPPDGFWHLYSADGAGNLALPLLASQSSVSGSSLSISGNGLISGTLTVGTGIAFNGATGAGTIPILATTNMTASGTTTLGGTTVIPSGGAIVGAGKNTRISFTSNGMTINLSSNGSALFDFLENLQTFNWGFGNLTPMVLNGSGSLSILGTLSQGSDERIKTKIRTIAPAAGAAWVMGSRPVEFEYRASGAWSAGFIAQEQRAAGYGDGVGAHPNPDLPDGFQLTLDLPSRIAFLTAALQHALSRIAALEAAAGK